jgi:hypothetical protein
MWREEGDPKGWSTVLITALGSWKKTVRHGLMEYTLNVGVSERVESKIVESSAVESSLDTDVDCMLKIYAECGG